MNLLQVTSHQLQLQQEAEKKAQQAAAEEAAKAKKKVVTEDSYAQLVDTQNVNRDANGVEARSVTEALSALGVKDDEDKHPERYDTVEFLMLLVYRKPFACSSVSKPIPLVHQLGTQHMCQALW